MEGPAQKSRMSLNHLSMLEKIQRRRELQVLRSRRYRERQRRKRQAMSGLSRPTAPYRYTHRERASQPTTDRRPPGDPLSKSSKSQSDSFWAPGLDDRTKYMMRANGLVVGFVWQKDEVGRTVLSGTRVVRFDPLRSGPPRGGYPKELLKNFSVKVAPEVQAPIHKVRTIHRAPKPVEDFIKVPEERHHQKKKAEETPRVKEIRKRLSRRKPLNSTRYALYRYFMMRCRSIYQVRRQNDTHELTNSETTRGERRTSQNSEERLLVSVQGGKRKRISGDLTLNSRLARLRTRLAVCSGDGYGAGARAGQRLLDLMSEEYNLDDPEDLEDNHGVYTIPTATGIRTGSGYPYYTKSDSLTDDDTDASDTERAQQRAQRSGRRKPKTLKVKRQREKRREECEQWGVEEEAEDEGNRQRRTQIKARRYQFLKTAKQSRLHQDQSSQPPPTEPTTTPNIIHVESLSEDNIQALSWEVAADTDPDTENFFLQHL